MTTKPPSKVKEFPENSLEKLAYNSVKNIPTVEPNDSYRLAYHVFQWLTKKDTTLKEAIRVSAARLLIPEEEAYKLISEYLQSQGKEIK
ncbi:MAG: hypothetical protein IGBAC_0761 [Ignavibacteriae bacterium]|nr:MAG: hypothetical protein IGBAC_0761 [Ignavibacteriota bacterium]